MCKTGGVNALFPFQNYQIIAKTGIRFKYGVQVNQHFKLAKRPQNLNLKIQLPFKSI